MLMHNLVLVQSIALREIHAYSSYYTSCNHASCIAWSLQLRSNLCCCRYVTRWHSSVTTTWCKEIHCKQIVFWEVCKVPQQCLGWANHAITIGWYSKTRDIALFAIIGIYRNQNSNYRINVLSPMAPFMHAYTIHWVYMHVHSECCNVGYNNIKHTDTHQLLLLVGYWKRWSVYVFTEKVVGYDWVLILKDMTPSTH